MESKYKYNFLFNPYFGVICVSQTEVRKEIRLPALCCSVDPSGWYGGYNLCYLYSNEFETKEDMVLKYLSYFKRVVLLNAVVPKHNGIVGMYKLPLKHEYTEVLGMMLRKAQEEKKLLSYIGHESTAKLLSKLFNINIQVNRDMYEPRKNDLAIVIRLKKRLPKTMDIDVSIDDLEIWMIIYK